MSFTHLHIYKSAAEAGHGEFVGRLQVGCTEQALRLGSRFDRNGYVVHFSYNQPELPSRPADERQRVMSALDHVMSNTLDNVMSVFGG